MSRRILFFRHTLSELDDMVESCCQAVAEAKKREDPLQMNLSSLEPDASTSVPEPGSQGSAGGSTEESTATKPSNEEER